MTIVIGDNSPRKTYTGNGSTTEFATDFAFFDKADVNVYVDGVLKTLNTDYTIPTTGANAWSTGNDGTVVFTTAPANNTSVVLTRDVTLERTTDFPTSGPFQVASLNTELDKVIAMIADMEDLAERGLRLSDTDTSASLVLADKDSRKGTVLAFNSTTGAVEVGPTIADTQSIADIKADIAALADIEDGTVATDAISDLAAIASDVTTAASNISAIQGASGNATAAQTAQTAAETAQTAAETAQTAAETAETNAAASATTATTKASEASTSATNAATSETNASGSATNAASSATAAQTAKDAALAALDSFDDRYLGVKTANPTVDNDGNALVAGAIYFNSTDGAMKVYTGSAWVAAYVDGSDYAALVGATFTGSVTMPTVDINGGAIDGTTIGGSTAAAGTFTTLQASGNVGLGETSPSKKLVLSENDSECVMIIKSSDTGSAGIYLGDQSDEIRGGLIFDNSTDKLQLRASDNQTAMTIDSSERVSIGTTSTASKFHVHTGSSGESYMQITNSTTGTNSSDGLTIGLNSAEQAIFWQRENNDIRFGTNNTTRMAIDSAGNVGIGTTSPSTPLHISATSPTLWLQGGASGQSNINLGPSTDGDEGGILYNQSSNYLAFRADAAERVRIVSTGSGALLVGGTSSDYATSGRGVLEVNGTSTAIVSLNVGNTGYGYMYHTGTNMEINNTRNGIINFKTNGTERMRIDSSGRVGIGTTSLTGGLNIKGDTPSGDGGSIYLQVNNNNSTDRTGIIRFGNNVTSTTSAISGETVGGNQNGELRFYTRDGSSVQERMRITSAGYIVPPTAITGYIGTSSTRWGTMYVHNLYRANEYVLSDRTEKQNISSITNGIDIVRQLNPVSYQWISDEYDDDTHYGFIAQEVEAVIPDIVEVPRTLGDDETEYGENEAHKYGIRQSEIAAYLTAALQEAIAKIETLETKVAALEAN